MLTVIEPSPSEVPPSDARWVHPSWVKKFLIGILAVSVAFVVTVFLPAEWMYHHPRILFLRYSIEQLFLYGTLPAMSFIGALRTSVLARAQSGVAAVILLTIWLMTPPYRKMHVIVAPRAWDWYEFVFQIVLFYMAAACAGALVRQFGPRGPVINWNQQSGGTT